MVGSGYGVVVLVWFEKMRVVSEESRSSDACFWSFSIVNPWIPLWDLLRFTHRGSEHEQGEANKY